MSQHGGQPVSRHSRHGKPRDAKRSVVAGLAVALVCALAGYLFVLNVQSGGSVSVNAGTADLLRERAKTVTQLQATVSTLSSRIETLKKEAGVQPDEEGASTGQDVSASVLPALYGPGLSVTLDDSPLSQDAQSGSNTDVNFNDYVVHQGDVEGVVNALWAGGAEAMMIMDQRVLPSTAVRCVGNVLLLQGHQYAPPFTIKAIGPVDGMKTALDRSQAVSAYKDYVRTIGLGWKLEASRHLEFPKVTAALQTLKYATELK